MKRQGLTITLNELHNLIDELSKEFDDGSPFYATDDNRKFQINIIKQTPECSDTWKLESNSQESLNVEKLDEMPDYETTDRVVAKDTRIPSNDNDKVIHPDSLLNVYKPKTTEEAINYLQQFLECDLYSKFRPEEIINNEVWTRDNPFNNENDFYKYLQIHFDLLREQLKDLKDSK